MLKPYCADEIYECLARQLDIRYLYEYPLESDEPLILTPEMLSPLPEALRDDLKCALESLACDRIDRAIRQVSQHDPKLQRTLAHFAETFDYPAMLKALLTN